MITIKVEENVPVPSHRLDRPRKYPWDEMRIGDSFLIPCDKGDNYQAHSARTAAGRWGKKYGMKFTTRRVNGGLRIWRIL